MPDDTVSNIRPGVRRPSGPDAHGQAALVLAESILHSLLEAGVLTLDQALAAVRTASEVKVDMAEEIGEPEDKMRQSIGLLGLIERSLETKGYASGKSE